MDPGPTDREPTDRGTTNRETTNRDVHQTANRPLSQERPVRLLFRQFGRAPDAGWMRIRAKSGRGKASDARSGRVPGAGQNDWRNSGQNGGQNAAQNAAQGLAWGLTQVIAASKPPRRGIGSASAPKAPRVRASAARWCARRGRSRDRDPSWRPVRSTA